MVLGRLIITNVTLSTTGYRLPFTGSLSHRLPAPNRPDLQPTPPIYNPSAVKMFFSLECGGKRSATLVLTRRAKANTEIPF
jgi:hypothetical protein